LVTEFPGRAAAHAKRRAGLPSTTLIAIIKEEPGVLPPGK
jgi:hypothetical protein